MTDTGLYSWQKHALDAWYARKRGIIQATTGSGKTRCAVHAYLKVNPRICYVVVPKVALLHEWYEEFSTAGITASRIGGKYKEDFSDGPSAYRSNYTYGPDAGFWAWVCP